MINPANTGSTVSSSKMKWFIFYVILIGLIIVLVLAISHMNPESGTGMNSSASDNSIYTTTPLPMTTPVPSKMDYINSIISNSTITFATTNNTGKLLSSMSLFTNAFTEVNTNTVTTTGPNLTPMPLKKWIRIASDVTLSKLFVITKDNLIGISNNRGLSWTIVNFTMDPRFYLSDICLSNNGNKILCCGNYFAYSLDGGLNWTYDMNSSIMLDNIECDSDMNTIIGVNDSGYLFTSSNSGTNWVRKDTYTTISNDSTFQRSWSSISISSDGTKMVACAYNDYIFISTDSGANWNKIGNNSPQVTTYTTTTPVPTSTPTTTVPTPVNIFSIPNTWVFVKYFTGGIIVGLDYGDLYISRNDGLTWEYLYSTSSNGIGKITTGTCNTDGSLIIIVGKNSIFTKVISYSTDGGKTWSYNQFI